jgi:hypothetical protein
MEAVLQRIPVIHHLGQHLLWVARKKPDSGLVQPDGNR